MPNLSFWEQYQLLQEANPGKVIVMKFGDNYEAYFDDDAGKWSDVTFLPVIKKSRFGLLVTACVCPAANLPVSIERAKIVDMRIAFAEKRMYGIYVTVSTLIKRKLIRNR